jgi:membrane associated rhomboid family serine protease
MPSWSSNRPPAWSDSPPPASSTSSQRAPTTVPTLEEPLDLDSLPPYKRFLINFGFPVVHEDSNGSSWLVWVLAMITTAFAVMTFPRLIHAIDTWGCVPAQAFRSGGMTIFSSFFVHAGWGHLIGNMYFLLLYGARTEWAIGAFQTTLLLAVSQILGVAIHGIWDPRRDMPLVGASAAVSGVMAFYALSFPQERFLYRFLFGFIIRPKAITLIGVWFVYQLFLARAQMAGLTNVSALGHLGGVVGGVLIWNATGRPRGKADGSISYEES